MTKKIAGIVAVIVLILAAGWFYLDLRKLAAQIKSYDTLILSKTEEIDKQARENSRLAQNLSIASEGFKKELEALRQENAALKSKLQDIEGKFSALKDSTVMQVKDFASLTQGLEGKTKDWMKESLTTMNAIETELFAQRQEVEVLSVSRLPQLESMIKKTAQQTDSLRASVQPESLRTLYDRMVRLEEKFNEMQDKVVDIILKQ